MALLATSRSILRISTWKNYLVLEPHRHTSGKPAWVPRVHLVSRKLSEISAFFWIVASATSLGSRTKTKQPKGKLFTRGLFWVWSTTPCPKFTSTYIPYVPGRYNGAGHSQATATRIGRMGSTLTGWPSSCIGVRVYKVQKFAAFDVLMHTGQKTSYYLHGTAAAACMIPCLLPFYPTASSAVHPVSVRPDSSS